MLRCAGLLTRGGVTLLLMASACGPAAGGFGPPERRSVPVERIGKFSRSPDGIAWLGDRIVVEVDEGIVRGVRSRLVELDPTHQAQRRLKLPPTEGCNVLYFTRLASLRRGTLGAARDCFGDRGVANNDFRLGEIGLEKPSFEPLTRNLDYSGLSFGWYSWNPDLTRAIASRSDAGLCSTLEWITREGIEPAHIEVDDGDRTWVIGPDLYPDCDGKPKADWPAWSPGGERIAFFFSTDAAERGGFSRLQSTYDLYLMGPNGEHPTKHLEGIIEPRSPIWSPDGKWLAFSGGYDGLREATWLYAPETGEIRFVSDAFLLWLDWSPDGTRIAGVPNPPPGHEILIYDVSSLID